MKTPIALTTTLALAWWAFPGHAAFVGESRAELTARNFVAERAPAHQVRRTDPLANRKGDTVLYVFHLAPGGFVLIAANDLLPPVIGWSPRNDFPLEGPAFKRVGRLLVADVDLRLSEAPKLPLEKLAERLRSWQNATSAPVSSSTVQYWPPAGTTATGGWVETQWDQGAPYNDDCPVDPLTSQRSVAGCPAVAMAQILELHRTTNGTRLDDGDDYHHLYAGRNFWIDDDWQTHGFPSFATLSSSLGALDTRYDAGLPADDPGAAALVFACGVAATQVYTSTVSGTFGVAQAVQAYERFSFQGFELLVEGDPGLYERMEHNAKNALPVHLAVVDPDWTVGHNVVVDGYCTDGTFHVNFGWGGPYDGWYLLPDEMPYGLTVVEGAIVDLAPALFEDGFESGDTSSWSTVTPAVDAP